MARPWVVTYEVELRDSLMVAEFFRGPRAECVRIVKHFAGGGDDRHCIERWKAIASPADNWDDYSGGGDVLIWGRTH